MSCSWFTTLSMSALIVLFLLAFPIYFLWVSKGLKCDWERVFSRLVVDKKWGHCWNERATWPIQFTPQTSFCTSRFDVISVRSCVHILIVWFLTTAFPLSKLMKGHSSYQIKAWQPFGVNRSPPGYCLICSHSLIRILNGWRKNFKKLRIYIFASYDARICLKEIIQF